MIVAYEYTTNGTIAPRTSLLTTQWVTTLDGSGATCSSWPCPSGKQTQTTYQYDGYGNPTQVLNQGDMDVTGDEVLTIQTYQPNTSAYLVGHVASTEVRGGTGAELLARSESWYDGATSASQAPTQGHVTTIRRYLKEESRYVEQMLGYDAWGNVTSLTDETGRTSTTQYDAVYNMFPVSATNGAGETTSSTWDAACATPDTATDLNGQVTTSVTDPFCRTVEVQLPGGGFEHRSYLDLGSPALQRVRVETPPPSSGTTSGDLLQEVSVRRTTA